MLSKPPFNSIISFFNFGNVKSKVFALNHFRHNKRQKRQQFQVYEVRFCHKYYIKSRKKREFLLLVQ